LNAAIDLAEKEEEVELACNLAQDIQQSIECKEEKNKKIIDMINISDVRKIVEETITTEISDIRERIRNDISKMNIKNNVT